MPNLFMPIGPDSDLQAVIRVINGNFSRIDNDSVVKTFNGPTGKPAIIQGKLKHGFYGTAYLDTDGNTIKLEGFDTNGDFIELVVKDGEDAYTVLGY